MTHNNNAQNDDIYYDDDEEPLFSKFSVIFFSLIILIDGIFSLVILEFVY